MWSLLHQSIIPKMFVVNDLLRIEYWCKLRLVHVYALTCKISNWSNKLKYEDTWVKYVGSCYMKQAHRTWLAMRMSHGSSLKCLRQYSHVMVA